ncbi:MAG: hypothetical protein K9G57_15750 [Ignavibacteriales bacterium]|nr:hypothetical protein [Ignavibacteriales bacterium]MCF8438301.1 hypothetical protein [Ignavibacteriales bacterium]
MFSYEKFSGSYFLVFVETCHGMSPQIFTKSAGDRRASLKRYEARDDM